MSRSLRILEIIKNLSIKDRVRFDIEYKKLINQEKKNLQKSRKFLKKKLLDIAPDLNAWKDANRAQREFHRTGKNKGSDTGSPTGSISDFDK